MKVLNFYCWQIVAYLICPLTSSTSKQNTPPPIFAFLSFQLFPMPPKLLFVLLRLESRETATFVRHRKSSISVGLFYFSRVIWKWPDILMRCSWLPLNQKVHGLILAATFIWKGLDDDHNMPGASFAKLSWLVLWTVTILMRHCSTSFPQSSIDLTFFLLFLIPDQIYAMLSSIGKRPKYYLTVEHNCRAKVVPRAPHLSSLYHVAIGQSASDVKTRGWQFEILVTLWKEISPPFATRGSFAKLLAAP